MEKKKKSTRVRERAATNIYIYIYNSRHSNSFSSKWIPARRDTHTNIYINIIIINKHVITDRAVKPHNAFMVYFFSSFFSVNIIFDSTGSGTTFGCSLFLLLFTVFFGSKCFVGGKLQIHTIHFVLLLAGSFKTISDDVFYSFFSFRFSIEIKQDFFFIPEDDASIIVEYFIFFSTWCHIWTILSVQIYGGKKIKK